MTKTDITEAISSDMTNKIDDLEISSKTIDAPTSQKETEWINPLWSQYYGYFYNVPDLRSAIIMKAIWNVGLGYTTNDVATKVVLDHISGNGKLSFGDVLFNMEVTRRINGDAFAEIIREKNVKTTRGVTKGMGKIINLKPLDPGNLKIIFNSGGKIIRYEETISSGTGEKKSIRSFNPSDIFHLTNNPVANSMHGLSDVEGEGMEETLLANEESFKDIKRIMHHQAKPFILWKLKTSDKTKIAEIVDKIDNARNLSEDMFIPDDDNAIQHEIVEIRLSQSLFTWRDDIRNKFYRTIMLPQIIPGASGQGTESESKVIFLAFEQIVERDQRYIEGQVWKQLFLKINLIPPASIKPNLQTDEAKDAGQGLNFQPGETTAGVG